MIALRAIIIALRAIMILKNNYCAFIIPFCIPSSQRRYTNSNHGSTIIAQKKIRAIIILQLLRKKRYAQSWFYNYCWNEALIIPSCIPSLQNKGYQVVSFPLHGIIKAQSWGTENIWYPVVTK